MIARLMILAVVGYTLAQETSVTTTISHHPTTTATTILPTTKTPTTTEILSSSSSRSTSSADMIRSTHTALTSMGSHGNCSACIRSFQKVYLHMNLTSNLTSDFNDSSVICPPVVYLNDSCVSVVNTDNCSAIISLLYTANSNLSFGLTCSATGLRVVKWTNCTGDSDTLRSISESNEEFCSMGGGDLNCSLDNNGIRRIHKVSVLEPFRKIKSCIPPTTSRPTIPLLPNPVGPGAITAIVVLVCLFITAVLAGFFFWPKCHMSKPPPPTPNKKQPNAEAFNVVAYSAASYSPTGAANATITVSPNQIGPAAA